MPVRVFRSHLTACRQNQRRAIHFDVKQLDVAANVEYQVMRSEI
jgi:hypothetical protein